MNLRAMLSQLLIKGPLYHAARRGWIEPPNPVTVTYSVTAACQSRCKTCRIGELFAAHPERSNDDLTLEEIETVFASMGRIYFFNVSGGEPFLRKDLPEIIELACHYLKPGIVHIPTNGIATKRVVEGTERILTIMEQSCPAVPLTVKPSIDGVGERHDEIRGFPGNWKRLLATIEGLKKLEARFPNFHLELGTVISRFNLDHLDEIAAFVRSAGVQSYRNEIAEQRAEFFNKEDPITPDAATYERLIAEFSRRIREDTGSKRPLAKMTESFRLEYYDLVVRILRETRQVIPCFAGISNVHINYDGEVWPCCVLGYDKPMGRLRESGLDFQRIWHSHQAREVRRFIASDGCACPLANQAYSNILYHPPSLARVARNFARFLLQRPSAEGREGP
ncbi:MAG: radical SAM protein [Deltaproteobacteria bacterium]|nr:radical SAM protein [Deltaproteobacteria bacterium]